MKKLVSLLLAALLLVGCTAALANTVLPPEHSFSEELFAGDCTVKAHFDPESAFDDTLTMTFTVMEDDLYPADAVKALQPGDQVILYGESVEVKSVTETEDGLAINAEGEDPGYEFRYTDDSHTVMYTSDTDTPSQTDMGFYTLPLAGEVIVRTWREDEPGLPSQELDSDTLTAADVKAFFLARNDPKQSDYLNCEGNHVTLRVQDGKVTEIEVDWGSDD